MEIAAKDVKLLRVPAQCPSIAMLAGTIEKLENVQNIVVLIEDDDGTWLMTLEGATTERINWMLDRAKLLLHRAD